MKYTIEDVLNLLWEYPDEVDYIEGHEIEGEYDTLADVIGTGVDWAHTDAPSRYWLELEDAIQELEWDRDNRTNAYHGYFEGY